MFIRRGVMRSQATTRCAWVACGALLVLGLALVRLFVRLVASYWAAFAMGTRGGNGMALIYIVAPVGVLITMVVAVWAWRAVSRRRLTAAPAIVVGAGGLVAIFALCFAIEAWRTADYPTESGVPIDAVAFLRGYAGL
jgi:hypothetical protein